MTYQCKGLTRLSLTLGTPFHAKSVRAIRVVYVEPRGSRRVYRHWVPRDVVTRGGSALDGSVPPRERSVTSLGSGARRWQIGGRHVIACLRSSATEETASHVTSPGTRHGTRSAELNDPADQVQYTDVERHDPRTRRGARAHDHSSSSVGPSFPTVFKTEGNPFFLFSRLSVALGTPRLASAPALLPPPRITPFPLRRIRINP